ncbi:MAG: hypothetical protein WD273_11935 [Trueperaceae bacterium]
MRSSALVTLFTRRPSPAVGATGAKPVLLNLSPTAQLRAGRLSRRLLQLFIGLTLFGISMSLMIQGQLGMLPWDVLHYEMAIHLPLSIGTIIILAGLAVLLMWIPLRQLPGLGTVANAIWIGVATDVTLRYLPAAPNLPWHLTFVLAGIVLNGVATAMYMGSQFGPGPRDGLMTGLARVTGSSLRLVRTGIEVAVVAVGWLLGGVVGVGTLLFAISIGPLTQFFLPGFIVALDADRGRVVSPSEGTEMV